MQAAECEWFEKDIPALSRNTLQAICTGRSTEKSFVSFGFVTAAGNIYGLCLLLSFMEIMCHFRFCQEL